MVVLPEEEVVVEVRVLHRVPVEMVVVVETEKLEFILGKKIILCL